MRQSDNSEAAVRLRPLVPTDVTYLSDLWVASWQEEAVGEIDFAGRRDWIAALLSDATLTTLVAEDGNHLVGFATLETSHLHQLVVAPAAKGSGAARCLLAAAKTFAAEGLTLEVNQANTRAMRFYEREGFVVEAAARNSISGLPTWRMRWRPPLLVNCGSSGELFAAGEVVR